MKQVKLKFPKKEANRLAKYIFENGIKPLLSYTEEESIFEGIRIVAIVAVEEGDMLTKFSEQFKSYFVTE